MIELLVLVVVGILAGVLAFRRFGTASGTLWNVWRIIISVVWLLSGVFLTVGGYVVVGVALIAVWTFIALGAASELRDDTEDDVRRSLGRIDR